MLTLNTYPVPNASVVGRVLEDEAVLVMPAKGEVKVLNEVGARIWTLIDGSRAVRGIVAEICAEYQVAADVAEVDTLEFLGELAKREIITLASRPSKTSNAP